MTDFLFETVGVFTQGMKMGRPSLLTAEAWRAPDGIRASVGGFCVPVLKGKATL